MNLKGFRDKVRYYRRMAGFSQQALAEAIGLYPTVLSAKLNGNDSAHLLTHPEIKRIIQTLAQWEAITRQAEASELLELVNLKLSAFMPQEWETAPLNRLEVLSAPPETPPAKIEERASAKPRHIPSPPTIIPPPLFDTTESSSFGVVTHNEPSLSPPIRTEQHNTEPSPLLSALNAGVSSAFNVIKPTTKLPAQLTSFVGRYEETRQVCTIFQNPDVRLLTLTGPGGTGKTRLALHVAAELHSLFPDGIFFVALSAISDSKLVIPTIAHEVLGLKDGDEAALAQSLINYLGDRQLLLVLDNFEQVLEAGPPMAELLAGAARVKILVTSRSLLHLYGEHEYPVPPLTLPPASAYLSVLPRLEEYSAMQLFVQRARAVRPDFALTEKNVKAVVEICTHLDGLPLAVELAAARCRMLSPEAMLPQLNKRLALVTGGPRNLPQRQQALRSTIEWSYNLLTTQEQQIFANLGVFVGGFSIEAAEGICNDETSVLEVIIALSQKNLLRQVQTPENELRFAMLETIREYASELLEKTGRIIQVQKAHLNYFRAWVAQIAPELQGAEQTHWADLLERDHDNVRAALQFALEQAEAESAGQLGLDLNWFWYIHSHVSEGRRWLDKILKLASKLSNSLYTALLRVAGQLAHVQGDYQHAIPLLEQSISLYRQAGDTLNLALALRMRGVSALNTSDYPKATALLEEALGLFRALHDNWGITMTLTRLGQVALEQGHYGMARQLLTEALALGQIQGDNAAIGYAELGLGGLALALGDYEQVQALADSGLARAQTLGDQNLIAWNLWNKAGAALGQGFNLAAHTFARQSYNIWFSIDDKMGQALALTQQAAIATAQNQFSEAESFYSQALELWQAQQSRLFCAICLEGLALVAKGQHQPKRTVYLWGAAASLREQIATPLVPAELPAYQQQVTKLRSELGEQIWNELWLEGAQKGVGPQGKIFFK